VAPKREGLRKVKAMIAPMAMTPHADLAKHPFFGSAKEDRRKVAKIMEELRGFTRFQAEQSGK
jgi:hypothetical protein